MAEFETEDMTFEVGGRNKRKKQIATAQTTMMCGKMLNLAVEYILPLYQFGFGY